MVKEFILSQYSDIRPPIPVRREAARVMWSLYKLAVWTESIRYFLTCWPSLWSVGEMSGKSIDKDHIRLSLSGPATEHPHGDVNYLCFTTKTPGRAKQSLQRCKTFNAVSWLHWGICKKLPFYSPSLPLPSSAPPFIQTGRWLCECESLIDSFFRSSLCFLFSSWTPH